MKFKKFQKKTGIEIPNFLNIFRNQNIYISGCNEIIGKYKNELKKLAKRSMIQNYLSGKSAISIDSVSSFIPSLHLIPK